jgi:hypothetical protein
MHLLVISVFVSSIKCVLSLKTCLVFEESNTEIKKNHADNILCEGIYLLNAITSLFLYLVPL